MTKKSVPALTMWLVIFATPRLLTPSTTAAQIHPSFSLADLTAQSQEIHELTLAKTGSSLKVKHVSSLKGRPGHEWPLDGKIQFAPLSTPSPSTGPTPAVWFQGQYTGLLGPQKAPAILLHCNGQWFLIDTADSENWTEQRKADELRAVWDGGTDMLPQAIKQILKFPATKFPTRPGSTWERPELIGTVPGKAAALLPVDLHRNGAVSLFVASDKGDSLFRREPNRETLTPVRLPSHSHAAVWGEFTGDQLLDYLSASNSTVTLWSQTTTGDFHPTAVQLDLEAQPQQFHLWGSKDQSAVLVSDRASLAMLVPGQTGNPAFRRVRGIKAAAKSHSGATIVADFDTDGFPDVLQIIGDRSFSLRGTSSGNLERGTQMPAPRVPVKVSHGIIADIDSDGLPDVMWQGPAGIVLWQNQGDGLFTDVTAHSGDLGRLAGTNIVSASSGDFNNDTYQDFVVFRADAPPQFFFNRGFRSYASTGEYDSPQILGAAAAGQQAGMLVDFDEDGAQDVVIVSGTGELWLLRQTAQSASPWPSLRVLVGGDKFHGPLTIRVFQDDRCLGGSVTSAGTAGAFFGFPGAGPIRLVWRFPGAVPQEKEFVLEEGELRVWLGRTAAGTW